jgi:predicted outer membrane repeat protein
LFEVYNLRLFNVKIQNFLVYSRDARDFTLPLKNFYFIHIRNNGDFNDVNITNIALEGSLIEYTTSRKEENIKLLICNTTFSSITSNYSSGSVIKLELTNQNVTFDNCTFQQCSAYHSGGAIYLFVLYYLLVVFFFFFF